MRRAIDETERRRSYQEQWNSDHGITPKQIEREVSSGISEFTKPAANKRGRKASAQVADLDADYAIDYSILGEKKAWQMVKKMEQAMQLAAGKLEFEKAAKIRDQLNNLRDSLLK